MIYRKDSLKKRIEQLKEYRYDLKEIGDISYEGYIRDKKIRYSIERLLFLIAENILDILDHILSSRFEIICDSYEDIIDKAYERNLLDETLYSKLKGLGGFRNVLAHEYLKLSHEEVYRNLKKMIEIIDSVIERFEEIISTM